MISTISIDDFLKLSDEIHLIDIRNSQNYNNNHIPNAINIPYRDLMSDFRNVLSFNIKYYIYCQKGITSNKVCSILNQLGYHTTSLSGGYEEWILKKNSFEK